MHANIQIPGRKPRSPQGIRALFAARHGETRAPPAQGVEGGPPSGGQPGAQVMIARRGHLLFGYANALGGEVRGDFHIVCRSWPFAVRTVRYR